MRIEKCLSVFLTVNLFVFVSAFFVYAETAQESPDRGMAGTEQTNSDPISQGISEFTKAIELNPGSAEAYYKRGKAYVTLSRLGSIHADQALADFTKAIELNPDYAEAYTERGEIYAVQSNFPQAVADYNRAIKLKPDDSEAYYCRGSIYHSQGNFAQAISDYTKAIELKPDDKEFYISRCICYYDMKDYDHAWDDAHKVEEFGNHPFELLLSEDFLEKLKKDSGRDK